MGWKPAMGVLAAAAAVGTMSAGTANADVPLHLSPFADLDCRCAGLMIAPPGIQKHSSMTEWRPEADGTVTSTTLPFSVTEINATNEAGLTETVMSVTPTDGRTEDPQHSIEILESLGLPGEAGSFRGYPSLVHSAPTLEAGPARFTKDMHVWANGRTISVEVVGNSADDVTADFDALTATLQIF